MQKLALEVDNLNSKIASQYAAAELERSNLQATQTALQKQVCALQCGQCELRVGSAMCLRVSRRSSPRPALAPADRIPQRSEAGAGGKQPPAASFGGAA
ncbi:hypothetical protein EON66_05805 [archaeon]|nr:MAG: hypothetical protein EON66_05805 [archaeon]